MQGEAGRQADGKQTQITRPADHNSGWRNDADTYDGLDLPEEDFNYHNFIDKEFGSAPKPAGVKTVWWIAAIVLIVVFVVIYFYAAH